MEKLIGREVTMVIEPGMVGHMSSVTGQPMHYS